MLRLCAAVRVVVSGLADRWAGRPEGQASASHWPCVGTQLEHAAVTRPSDLSDEVFSLCVNSEPLPKVHIWRRLLLAPPCPFVHLSNWQVNQCLLLAAYMSRLAFHHHHKQARYKTTF